MSTKGEALLKAMSKYAKSEYKRKSYENAHTAETYAKNKQHEPMLRGNKLKVHGMSIIGK